MSAVWLDPHSLMDSSATADSRSLDSGVSVVRHDTPHLSAHEHQRWQYSPVHSEPDIKRVRRNPSIQNLTGRSAHSAFARMPSSVPPPSIHNFSSHLQLQQPSTPRPRAYTSSPSLSSTITTLQSTPTHTPILRGGSFDEQRGNYDRCGFESAVGTKRKYPSVKHARRFPRRRPGEEGSRDSGIYKVYAAVFDISGEEEGLIREPNLQAVPISKQGRAVQFAEHETRHDYDISSISSSGQSHHRRDQTVTSSFSLSKFEFPAPPNKDNWTGAINYIPKSPPATVLYRGASFDLINPHASLLLGNHSIETPAEIDCLLDDYFEEREDFAAISSSTNEMSQQSLRSVSDSKQTHVLYDDADTARRNILRIPTPNSTKGNVAASNPPATAVTMPNIVRQPDADVDPGPTPPKRSNTNPFRNRIADLVRSLGLSNSAGNRDLAEEGRSAAHTDTYGFSTTTQHRTTQHQVGAKDEDYSPTDDERFSNMSNPFDLTVSEMGNNAERLNIDGVTMRERDAMLASASEPTGRRTAPTVEDGSNPHATSENGGDHELSFINRYDYTREIDPRAENHLSLSDPSVELGRGAAGDIEDDTLGWARPLSPNAQFRSSSLGCRTVEDLNDMLPRPLASRRNGVVQQNHMASLHRDMRLSGTSDVPTSEKTYGETNQLLQITPNTNRALADNAHMTDGRQNPLTRQLDASPGSQYRNDNLDNPFALDDDESMLSMSSGRPESIARMRTASVVVSPSVVHITDYADINNRFSVPSQFRTSSEAAEAWVDVYEDESGAEPEDSPGCTEDEDLDDSGNRYSHSSESRNRRNIALPGIPLPVASSDHRQHLALDSFPNLTNPTPEISPQRQRGNGRGRDIPSYGNPHTPILYGSSQTRYGKEHVQRSRPSIDYAARPTGDVKRALLIMKRKATNDKLGAGKFMSPGAHSTREYGDMKELERIRVENPQALEEATRRFEYESRAYPSPPNVAPTPSPMMAQMTAQMTSAQNRLKKIQLPANRQDHHPSNSFKKAAAFSREQPDHGSFSSQRGLLQPEADTNLQFSASEGTFVTIRKKRDKLASNLDRSRNWDPHGVNPTDHALDHVRSLARSGVAANSPKNTMSAGSRSGQQPPTAIGGQIELRTFKLPKAPPRKGLTDKQLAKRAPTWEDYPTEASPPSESPKLRAHNEISQEQRGISLKYRSLSALIPFGALIYGLGGFDRVITRKTGGRITSMDPKQKCYVLKVYFPLQMLGYCILALVIGITVHLTRKT